MHHYKKDTVEFEAAYFKHNLVENEEVQEFYKSGKLSGIIRMADPVPEKTEEEKEEITEEDYHYYRVTSSYKQYGVE